MKKIILSFALLVGVLAFTSCEKDDDINFSETTIDINIPISIPDFEEEVTISSGEYIFKNVSSGEETKIPITTEASASVIGTKTDAGIEVRLQDGTYHITFTGTGSYEVNTTGHQQDVMIQGSKENVEILGGKFELDLDYVITEPSLEGNLVLAELFLAGTRTPEAKPYNGDQYIRIHNNSNKVLYADSLILIESKFNTNTKREYTPSIMAEAVAVHFMFMIPGDGKTYPILPGEDLIIADNAIDHTMANANSVNLSDIASFEWHSDLSTVDVDNPEVPNAINIYLSTGKFWMASKQGNRAYVIGRLPAGMTTDMYLEDYKYDYQYELAGKPRDQKAYKFPNTWVIDAVNLCPSSDFEWTVVANTLDIGYTSLGATTSTTTNATKAVVRKKDATKTAAEGRTVLMDTNNSTNDFDVSVKATLLP